MSAAGLCLVLLGMVSGTPPENLSLDLEGRLETLVGTNISAAVPPKHVSAIFSLTPGVLLTDRSQTGVLKLSYTPLLYLTVPGSDAYPAKVLVLNRFNYDASNQLSRTSSISLIGALWFGDQNYSPVVNQGLAPGSGTGQPSGIPPPPGQLPAVQIIRVITSTTQLGFTLATSATVQLAFAAGFLFSEGANDASRLELPLQRGPFVLARSEFLLSERDTLTPALRVGFLSYGPIFWTAGSTVENGSSVTVAHFQEGLELLASELTLKWGHQESRALRTEAAVGLAVFNQSSSSDVPVGQTGELLWYARSIPVPAETFPEPIARATVLYNVFPDEEPPLQLGATAALAPILNQFAGTVYERVEGILTADWTLSPFVRLGALAGEAYTFSPPETDIRGEVRAVWSPATSVAIAGGVRAAWINYVVPGAFNGFSWSVFINVTGATGALF